MTIIDYCTKGLFSPHDGRIETLQTQLHWTLRVSVALCFIGHGTWGLITKAGWLPFFASQGIPLDVLWALWTAALRPLAGNLEKFQENGEWFVRLATDSMNVPKMQTWEFWERAGNWAPPLMLLIMGGVITMRWKDWIAPYVEPLMKETTVDTIFFILRTTLALLLIGHAGFGFAAEKQMLIDHWQSIGVNADINFIRAIGFGELALGILVFCLPIRPLIWTCLVWKFFTEFLYVPADTVSGMGWVNIFETIERWGDSKPAEVEATDSQSQNC